MELASKIAIFSTRMVPTTKINTYKREATDLTHYWCIQSTSTRALIHKRKTESGSIHNKKMLTCLCGINANKWVSAMEIHWNENESLLPWNEMSYKIVRISVRTCPLLVALKWWQWMRMKNKMNGYAIKANGNGCWLVAEEIRYSNKQKAWLNKIEAKYTCIYAC